MKDAAADFTAFAQAAPVAEIPAPLVEPAAIAAGQQEGGRP
ncbi:hypothetical protein [Herbidospora mongoliensis]|nr:hypothetical protein [Herbidospora mongoliensis]